MICNGAGEQTQPMPSAGEIRQQFERDGIVWLRDAIQPAELQRLRELSALDNRPGARISEEDPLFRTIASASFTKKIRSLWLEMRPVRLVSFDKSAAANWGVPWHQDRVIAVNKKADLRGYSNWSRKHGAWHCEPPASLLANMLFVRVHLDRNAKENGAMEIALGSHRLGKVPAESASFLADKCQKALMIAEPGDVLVLAMLTLHRSLPAEITDSRRVLRVDYAPCQLPKPLEWAA
jgi:hypothetical protein